MRVRDWIIISGNSNLPLAEKVSEKLGKPLAQTSVKRFSDGEVFVEVQENVRGRAIYIVQSTCPPVNDNLMELLVMIDALKRASARDITVIVPYYGYARQDRKVAPRTPISAKLVADLIAAAGADRVVSMDLHAGQIQGFFNIPFDNVFAMPVMLDAISTEIGSGEEFVIVSPDAGGVERARAYAKRLHASVAMIDKRRIRANEAKAMNIVGEVKGKRALILDDMIDTAGTLTEAATALINNGAIEVSAAATHGVLSGPAIDRINGSALKKLIITDTIPTSPEALKSDRIQVVSVADLIAEAIHRIHNYDSLSSLFV